MMGSVVLRLLMLMSCSMVDVMCLVTVLSHSTFVRKNESIGLLGKLASGNETSTTDLGCTE